MSRLNPTGNGEYLGGVGGGAGNLHVVLASAANGSGDWIGTPFLRDKINDKLGIPRGTGEGSGWLWKDGDTIAGQFCGDPTSPTGCSMWFYNIRTNVLTGPFGHGANNGVGRGGVAAFWLGTGAEGVYSTTGYRNQIGAVPGVFDNGDMLILNDYQQATLGFTIVRGTSPIAKIPTIGQIQGAFARGSIALWFDTGDNRLHAYGAPDPVSVPAWNHPSPFASDKSGRLWLANGAEGLLLRAWDQPAGLWLSHDAFNFSPDIVQLRSDGRLRVVSSTTSGEAPGTFRVWDVDPLTGNYTLNGQPGHADLVDLNTGAPIASLPTPTHVTSTSTTAGVPNDLFPIAVGVFGLGAYYLLTRER